MYFVLAFFLPADGMFSGGSGGGGPPGMPMSYPHSMPVGMGYGGRPAHTHGAAPVAGRGEPLANSGRQ